MTYIVGILERLGNPNLQKLDNPGRIVLDGTLGEYLEHYDNHILDMFLVRADGSYLDLHGRDFGIFRRDGESDTDYRTRILLEESMLETTTDFSKLDVSLWVYRDGVVDDKNVLTSRNPYLKNQHDTGYVFIASGSDMDYLVGKFILEDLLWV